MAKTSTRPEVKAQKMKNNKTSNLPLICKIKDCEDEATLIKGAFENRHRVCWEHHVNPPMTATQKTLARYGLI